MKKVILLLLISIFVISGVLVADYVINSGFKTVKVQSVFTTTVEDYVELSGEVTEEIKREIKADFPLEITAMYAEVGDKVTKGQKLAELDDASLINKLEFSMIESNAPESFESIISQVRHLDKSIYSPIDGVISYVGYQEGDTIAIEKSLFTVTDTENLKVRSKISSDIINEIYLNQKVIIYSENEAINGKISKIYPVAEKTDLNNLSFIAFEITPENSDKLTCGTVVEIKLLNEVFNDVIVIPFDSVMFDDEYPYVYVEVSGYAVKKRVVIGKEFETTVEIKEGLSRNDKLLTEPKKYNIKNGDKITYGE